MNKLSQVFTVFLIFTLSSCGPLFKKEHDQNEIDFIREDERGPVDGNDPITPGPTPTPPPLPGEVDDSKPFADSHKATSSCEDGLTSTEFLFYKELIEILGLDPVVPDDKYTQDLNGLKEYFDDSNFRGLDLDRLASPGQPAQLAECRDKNDPYIRKYPHRRLTGNHLIPPKACWMRYLAVLKFVQTVNESAGVSNYKITSYYRPQCYNDKVGGAEKSDHVDAQAIDVYYPNARTRLKVQQAYCQVYWKLPFYEQLQVGEGHSTGLNLATGLGSRLIHFSLGARDKRTKWAYSSYLNDKDHQSNDCWSFGSSFNTISRDGFFE